MTVAWHVDLKVSHVEEYEVKKLGNFLKSNLEKNDLKITHHCGNVHDYLGIGLDYAVKRQIQGLDGLLPVQYP